MALNPKEFEPPMKKYLIARVRLRSHGCSNQARSLFTLGRESESSCEARSIETGRKGGGGGEGVQLSGIRTASGTRAASIGLINDG
eukprot:scaffold223969_cov30-Tisochrysis_lutea.AAC.7